MTGCLAAGRAPAAGPSPTHQREQHGGRTAHAAAADQAVLRMLQSHDLLLRCPSGGVAIPPILKASEAAFLVRDQLGGVVERVRGGLHDWRGERVSHALAHTPLCLSAMDCQAARP